MATSPIYSWPEPDNTDLVKNGALAIRTLGNAIDTTMATMTPKSLVDAKGDLIAASANDTPARLAVGNNGETLVADSSTSTGLRYQGHVEAGKNNIINGGFDIWQRGTTGFSAGGNYCADRWICALNSGTLAVSRSTDVPTSPYLNYSLSMVGTTAQNAQIFTRIESANSTLFAGQTVTLSLWAKNGGGTTKLSYVGLYPTATDNFASNTTDVLGDLTATSWSGSWTRYSVTFTANALATRGYMILLYRNGTETSTTLFAGVQLEIGSVATNFSRTGGSIQGETSACQRYYFRNTASQAYSNFSYAMSDNSTTVAVTTMHLPVTMRVAPTSVDFSNIRLTNNSAGFPITAATVSGTFNGSTVAGLSVTVASGIVPGGVYTMQANNNVAGYVGVSAEL